VRMVSGRFIHLEASCRSDALVGSQHFAVEVCIKSHPWESSLDHG
jgi:hypothetical protein